jgi:hypothetical protein
LIGRGAEFSSRAFFYWLNAAYHRQQKAERGASGAFFLPECIRLLAIYFVQKKRCKIMYINTVEIGKAISVDTSNTVDISASLPAYGAKMLLANVPAKGLKTIPQIMLTTIFHNFNLDMAIYPTAKKNHTSAF